MNRRAGKFWCLFAAGLIERECRNEGSLKPNNTAFARAGDPVRERRGPDRCYGWRTP
jgi:hypothetical protein